MRSGEREGETDWAEGERRKMIKLMEVRRKMTDRGEDGEGGREEQQELWRYLLAIQPLTMAFIIGRGRANGKASFTDVSGGVKPICDFDFLCL